MADKALDKLQQTVADLTDAVANLRQQFEAEIDSLKVNHGTLAATTKDHINALDRGLGKLTDAHDALAATVSDAAERRAVDQDAALERAFADGDLPEEDRRRAAASLSPENHAAHIATLRADLDELKRRLQIP